VALLEELLLLHVIFSEYIFVLAIEVLIRALLVLAGASLQEELAVLGPPERRPHQPLVKVEGVYSKHGNASLPSTTVCNICRVAQSCVI